MESWTPPSVEDQYRSPPEQMAIGGLVFAAGFLAFFFMTSMRFLAYTNEATL